MVEQECGSTRDPPYPASIDMGLLIKHGVSPDAADDTEHAPHRPNVYVTDVPRAKVSCPSDGTHIRPIHRKESASIDIGLLIKHGVSPDAADDA